METVITKFMMMEVRSVRMMRLVREFAEWYRKEYHLHVDLTNRSMIPSDYWMIHDLRCKIYDEAVINEYDTAGRGHQLLRLVNSNFAKITDLLNEILRYCSLDDGTEIETKVRDLSKLLGIENPDERKLLDPAFLQDLLSKASDMMDSPVKFFDGAGCYSISGMTGTSKYMDTLKECRFALINDNEYKIAEAFFEYVANRKWEV